MRSRFKLFIALMVVFICLELGVASAAVFPDIEGHWAQGSIEKWVSGGLVSGYPDATFQPDKQITRAEFVILVNKAFNKKDDAAVLAFSDVSTSDWFYKEVVIAKQAGYMSGYADGTFRPNKPITREEAAVMAANILNQTGMKKETVKQFIDAGKMSSWACDSIGVLVINKVMSGYPDGTFGPDRNISRAEAIVMLDMAVTHKGQIGTNINGEPLSGTTANSNGSFDNNSGNNPTGNTDLSRDLVEAQKDYTKDSSNLDLDGDGLSDYTENFEVFTNPNNVDTDGDGLTDGEEVTNYHTSPLLFDTDFDGLPDEYEITIIKTDPCQIDSDGNGIDDGNEDPDVDGLSNFAEYQLKTDPLNKDSDLDGLSDGDEVSKYDTDPLNYDTDGDRLSDGDEISMGLDPLQADTDGDGIVDSEEKTDQELSADQLLALDTSDNGVIPQIALSCTGNFNESTIIRDVSDNPLLAGIDGFVGHPVDIETSSLFDTALLSFRVRDDILAGTDINDLIIVNYDYATNEIKPLDTLVDEENKTISTTVNHFSTYGVMNKNTLSYNWDVENQGSILEKGKADVVFVLDTTGSMGGTIYSVKANIVDFVNELAEKKVDARLGLIEFRDIVADGPESTKNWGWYINPADFKNKLDYLYADGGGDEPESDVDALEEARRMGFRSNVTKFIILITDTYYKEETRFTGLTSMEQEVAALKADGIITSVISDDYYQAYYDELFNETDGLFANIYDNFSSNLSMLIDKISSATTDGIWIRLANGTVVKLDKQPDKTDLITDTDEDGLPDSQELIEEIEIILEPGSAPIKAWTFTTNPANPDTDGDGIIDSLDDTPLFATLITNVNVSPSTGFAGDEFVFTADISQEATAYVVAFKDMFSKNGIWMFNGDIMAQILNNDSYREKFEMGQMILDGTPVKAEQQMQITSPGKESEGWTRRAKILGLGTDGQYLESKEITLTVKPHLQIQPISSEISGKVNINVNVYDTNIKKVGLYIQKIGEAEQWIATTNAQSLTTIPFDSTLYNGQYQILARGTDALETNVLGESKPVKVIIKNAQDIPSEYEPYISQLKAAHPEWKFSFYYPNVDLDEFVNIESKLYPRTDLDAFRGAPDTKQPGWSFATKAGVSFFANPLHFLNDNVVGYGTADGLFYDDKGVYQFIHIGFDENSQKLEDVSEMLKGSYFAADIDNYANWFYNASKLYGINPYVLVSKSLVEGGAASAKPSSLLTGYSYNGRTVYNFFGINCRDSNPMELGAQWAFNHGCFSPQEAIYAGAQFVSSDYIQNGQDTYYTFRYDLPGLMKQSKKFSFAHQYATNIADGWLKGSQLYKVRSILDHSDLTIKIPVFGAGVTGEPKPAVDESKLEFRWPLDSNHNIVVSAVGPRYIGVKGASSYHKGWDISDAKVNGAPVYASNSGTVTLAGNNGGAGNMVTISHKDEDGKVFYTSYMHLSEINVTKGQEVSQETIIGKVGSTGNSGGPHLHFEIKDASGSPVDPEDLLNITVTQARTQKTDGSWVAGYIIYATYNSKTGTWVRTDTRYMDHGCIIQVN